MIRQVVIVSEAPTLPHTLAGQKINLYKSGYYIGRQ
jgi:hypothetical protein